MIRAREWIAVFVFAAVLTASGISAFGQEEPPPSPAAEAISNMLTATGDATQPGRISSTLFVFFLLTVLSLAPAILMMTTSFIRIVVVLGFLRQAMATQQSPPNQVIVGLALFLTFFVMTPTYTRVYDEAVAPYMAEDSQMTTLEFAQVALEPIRDFMFRQVREKDLALFLNITDADPPETLDDIPTTTLMPAFVISELRKAFEIGFYIYIPFLVIDMVVASTLMAMGMMMLPPVFVSLPFKIVMFVLADGWYLLIEELVSGFA